MASSPIQLVPLPSQPLFLSPKRKSLWQKHNGLCHWCGALTRLINDNAWDKATIDHVLPRYKGGTNAASNLVLACNRCNNRRCYEDQAGLPDGSMLGKYKQTQSSAERKQARRVSLGVSHIALTGDEKKAIMAGTVPSPPKHKAEDVLREQRDQALKELALVRKEVKFLHELVADQEKELKGITVWGLLRKRIAQWISP